MRATKLDILRSAVPSPTPQSLSCVVMTVYKSPTNKAWSISRMKWSWKWNVSSHPNPASSSEGIVRQRSHLLRSVRSTTLHQCAMPRLACPPPLHHIRWPYPNLKHPSLSRIPLNSSFEKSASTIHTPRTSLFNSDSCGMSNPSVKTSRPYCLNTVTDQTVNKMTSIAFAASRPSVEYPVLPRQAI